MAKKHNALVDLIAAMTGAGGAVVAVSENNIIVSAGSGSDVISRIEALEALLSGYADTEADICPSGTVTILAK